MKRRGCNGFPNGVHSDCSFQPEDVLHGVDAGGLTLSDPMGSA